MSKICTREQFMDFTIKTAAAIQANFDTIFCCFRTIIKNCKFSLFNDFYYGHSQVNVDSCVICSSFYVEQHVHPFNIAFLNSSKIWFYRGASPIKKSFNHFSDFNTNVRIW